MNDPTTVAQALQALSRSSTARTQVARLRELLPDIEAAQAAGVKHQHILEALNAHGFTLSMKAYSVMLYRLRQARAKSAGASVPSGAQHPAPQSPVAAAMTGQASGAQHLAAAPGASTSAPKPGEPQRFDWDELKKDQPEW